MLRFIITSRLESHRHPRLRACSTPVVDAVSEFYESMVADAVRRGEIPDGVDATAVVNMLASMFWGMGFFAGFVHKADEVMEIAKQLQRFLAIGLPDGPVGIRSLTNAARTRAAVAADGFARTCP
jgi:hypothetical protein